MLPGTDIGLPRRGTLYGVVVAALSLTAATVVRAAVDPVLSGLPFVTYVLAVVVAAWVGGRAAGLLTVAGSVLAADYFFLEPRGSFVIGTLSGRLGAVAFLVVSACLLAVVFAWRRDQSALLRGQRVFAQAGGMAHLGAWAIEISNPDDVPGSPLFWSDETYRIFGYAPRSVRATNELFFSHVHPADRQRVNEAMTMALAERRAYSIQHRIVRPDGAERIVDEHAEIEFDATGRPCWVVGAVQDVTDRKLAEDALRSSEETARRRAEELERLMDVAKRLEEELRQNAQQLEEASRLKDEFIATVSHELRTPLNAMLGWAELLRERRLDKAGEERALEVIAGNARRQSQLIEDLLDMSRIVAGKLRLDPRPIDPAGPVAAAIEAVLPSAHAKGVTVRPPAPTAHGRVFADAARLQQVVWNLLTNAVKFTGRGGEVLVDVQARAGEVDIVVRDTGSGIAPAFLPHVFDRFRQADSRSTRAHAGLGIGLSIVKHLVEAQGGRVRAESAGEHQGATFFVTLPVQHAFEEKRHAAAGNACAGLEAGASVRHETLRGVRVLAVDDEPDARELTGTMLRQHGANVMTAGSVDDAIRAVGHWRPDVLVVDIAMPGADGFALLQRLSEIGGPCAGIPAVALTAYAREEDRRRGVAAGFRHYLTKPVDEATLLEAVAALAPTSRSTGL